MDSIIEEELLDVARVVEVTSDAVLLCGMDGTVLHTNRQMLQLCMAPRDIIIGSDVKDILYSTSFERAEDHRMPFGCDGDENTCMLKLADGSFIPVHVRALSLGGEGRSRRLIIAIKSLEERYAHDRKTQRLLSELQASNKRLSGTLSVIMSTVGSNDLPALLDTVLNKMAETLDASGTTIYFAESGGFKLRGISKGLAGAYVPEFVPYGAGIATYVLHEQRPCRLTIVPASADGTGDAGEFYDLDARTSHRLRIQNTPPFKTLIVVPVFFGTQMLGVVELGWMRPCTPREYDVRVLEVICDYLSIELVGLVATLRSARTAELSRSLNRVRELFFAMDDDRAAAWGEMADEIRRMLSCRLLPVYRDGQRDTYVLDYDGGNRIDLPGTPQDMFFSVTVPAARMGSAGASEFTPTSAEHQVSLARVDRTMPAGGWLESKGLPSRGVFVDLGSCPGEACPDDAQEHLQAAENGSSLPRRMFLLLRDGSQEPIDDIEFDYLTRLAHDYELVTNGTRRQKSERRIAQTLQAGMRSSLGGVPGIATDSLYSSATSQALVGGDFYTLIRLPDDRAVMILGDVSGKGIEAASMSALVKTALSAYAWEGASPARMARSLNSMLMSFSRVETFATAFIAKIDLRARQVAYCSAGHPPAMLLHPVVGDVGEAELLSVQSGVLGAFEDMPYENGTLVYEPGDILFMYTDGALEARNAAGDFFGEQRLRDVLMHAVGGGVEGLCAQVLGELDTFTDSALDDDIALVALQFDENE